MTSRTVAQLAELVHADVIGNAELEISDGQSLEHAGPDHIAFVAEERYLRQLEASRAGAALVPSALSQTDSWHQLCESGRTLLVVPDALLAFLEILTVLRPQAIRREPGISHSARVHPSAVIGDGSTVYPGAQIAADTQLGERCTIHPNAVIGAGCRLGDDVTLFPGVVLYPGCVIGHQVTVHANSVVGSDGFGYRPVDGRHRKLPHLGTVRVEDNVEIGSCVSIDRGMIGETIIGEGTKIDNQVHIAHNCQVGRHSLIMASVAFAGSVTTGDYLVCAGQVGVADHTKIGSHVTIGAQAGITRNVPDGDAWIGSPAHPAAETRRIWRTERKLPEMWKMVRELQKQVAALEETLADRSTAAHHSDRQTPDGDSHRSASSPAA